MSDEPGGTSARSAARIPPSRFRDRIARLAAEAERARRGAAVRDEPDPDLALERARDGLGPVVACYVEARTSDDPPRFSSGELSALHRATSDWCTAWARALGVDHEAEVTVREAAELLLSTHDVTDVAAALTGVRRDRP